jgi:hypothetical protein
MSNPQREKPAKVLDLALPPTMWTALEEAAEKAGEPFGMFCEHVLEQEIPKLGKDPRKAQIFALPTTGVSRALRISVDVADLVRDTGETLHVTGRCVAYTAMCNYWDRRGKKLWF